MTLLARLASLFRRRRYTYPLRGHTLDFSVPAAQGRLNLNSFPRGMDSPHHDERRDA